MEENDMNLIFEEDKKTHGNIFKEIIIWVICIALSILAGYLVTEYAIEKTRRKEKCIKYNASESGRCRRGRRKGKSS